MHEDYAYYFEEEAKKYQFALDSKDQELAAKDQELTAKDQELTAKDQQLAAIDQKLAAVQAKIRSMEETMFNMVLYIERIQNISFQEALAISGCSLEMQEKFLQMAQDKGLLVV